MKIIIFVLCIICSHALVAKNNELRKSYSYFTLSIQGEYSNFTIEAINKFDQEYLKDEKDYFAFTSNLEDILKSQGFYEYKISLNPKTNQINVILLRPYIVKKINFYINNDLIHNKFDEATKLQGKRVELQEINDLETHFRKWVEKNKCFYDLKSRIVASIDKKEKSITVNYYFEGINNAVFGKVNIEPLENLDSQFISKTMHLKEGACYKKSEVDFSKVDLLNTSLFEQVTFNEKLTPNKKIDIDVVTRLAKAKTVEVSTQYGTTEKFGLGFYWVDRNINKMGQALSLRAKYSKDIKNAELSYYIPFFRNNKNLTSKLQFESEEYLDYREKSFSTGFLIGKDILENHNFQYGVNFKKVFLRNDDLNLKTNSNIYSLISVYTYKKYNMETIYDGSIKWQIKLEPTISNDDGKYLKTYSTLEKYTSITDDNAASLYLYNKFGVGMIIANKANSISDGEKYFLGGSTNIRGYDYKSIGVMENDYIRGGKSYFFLRSELIYKINTDWAFGMFGDIGKVTPTTFPKFSKPVSSVGITTKYFINSMPIGLDIAYPLDQEYRKKKRYQIYMNVGWSF